MWGSAFSGLPFRNDEEPAEGETCRAGGLTKLGLFLATIRTAFPSGDENAWNKFGRGWMYDDDAAGELGRADFGVVVVLAAFTAAAGDEMILLVAEGEARVLFW